MTDSLPTRDQIQPGFEVKIEPKENQGTGTLVDGIVDEILTTSKIHPHGIKVKMKNGQVGRVKKIVKKHFVVRLQDNISSISDHMDFQKTLAPNTSESHTVSRFIDLDKKDIPKTEDTNNEFKECYQYDKKLESSEINRQTKGGIMRSTRERVAIAVCSFGNSYVGGFVYIGIDRKGKIIGLERDLKLGNFADYSDDLANNIRDRLGKMLEDKTFIVSKVRMKFRKIEEKTICIIQIIPSSQPIFLHTSSDSVFYVRGSVPRAEKLTGLDQYRYIKDRFPDYK